MAKEPKCIYYYVLDEESGSISQTKIINFEISEYGSGRGRSIRYRRDDYDKPSEYHLLYENDMERVLRNRIYSFSLDYSNACEMFIADTKKRVESAKLSVDRYTNLLDKIQTFKESNPDNFKEIDRDILTIHVNITAINEVKGHGRTARMILFDGDCNNNLFSGYVLPGGVDTQTDASSSETLLSARYILEGHDKSGEECRIFVENNGKVQKGGKIFATPQIVTDSKLLSYLEKAKLSSEVEGVEGGVIVHIFKAEDDSES
ncbi:hypothetical protein [Butyrivibrio sp. AC2005]|uniref:hypothetical protein n=1 Tax=Butyrivibrio sp. AC2005 TaxID=1280672 RepID=UPI0004215725|nr:hypothetical protein [Butyrivibrio sp. AC2005]